MKKFLATVALILALLVTTACLAEGIEFPLAESVTITAITHAPSFAPQDFSQRLIYKRLEENTNVVIDWTCYVDDQFGETKNLILSRKDLPDMVFDAQMGQYDVLRYADDGTIIAVDELMSEAQGGGTTTASPGSRSWARARRPSRPSAAFRISTRRGLLSWDWICPPRPTS